MRQPCDLDTPQRCRPGRCANRATGCPSSRCCFPPRMTVKRGATAHPMFWSMTVPQAQPSAANAQVIGLFYRQGDEDRPGCPVRWTSRDRDVLRQGVSARRTSLSSLPLAWVPWRRISAAHGDRRHQTVQIMRVSHPLRSTSTHPDPNWARSYPVLGARPLTFSASTARNAAPTVGSVVARTAGGEGAVLAFMLGVALGALVVAAGDGMGDAAVAAGDGAAGVDWLVTGPATAVRSAAGSVGGVSATEDHRGADRRGGQGALDPGRGPRAHPQQHQARDQTQEEPDHDRRPRHDPPRHPARWWWALDGGLLGPLGAVPVTKLTRAGRVRWVPARRRLTAHHSTQVRRDAAVRARH